MRQLLSVAVLALIAGCADQPAAPVNVASAAEAAAPAASAAQYCRKEVVIGSNLPQTVCHSAGGDPHDPATDQSIRDMQRAGAQQIQGIHH